MEKSKNKSLTTMAQKGKWLNFSKQKENVGTNRKLNFSRFALVKEGYGVKFLYNVHFICFLRNYSTMELPSHEHMVMMKNA